MNNKELKSYELRSYGVTGYGRTVIARNESIRDSSELRFATRFSRLPKFNPANLINLMKISVMTILFTLWGLGGFASFAQGFSPFVGSGGNGTQGNPYLISTPADLVELANYVNSDTVMWSLTNLNTNGKYFKMTNDINMANVSNFGMAYNGYYWFNSGIGTGVYISPYRVFSGNFDGGGFTIKNLDSYSLFLATVKASISNLTLDSSFTIFVWEAYESNFENCVNMNCTIKYPTGNNVCGFGNIYGGHVSNCHVINAELEGNSLWGFGSITNAEVINSSVSNSTLIGHRFMSASSYVCGFGGAQASSFSSCHVSNCIISGDMVSGFIFDGGECQQVYNCYAQSSLYRTIVPTLFSTVFQPWAGEQCVGLVTTNACDYTYDNGYILFYNTIISNSYAACDIITLNNDYTYVGSFGTAALGAFTNNYYLIQPLLNAFWSGSSPEVVGKTQPALKDTNMVAYPGTRYNSLNYQQPNKPWVADDSKNPINKGYPILWWQQPAKVITLAVTEITRTSATIHGTVSKNADSIVERGFQWREAGNSAWTTIILSDTTTAISDTLAGLTPNTTYEFKAYIIAYNIRTRAVTKYGDTLIFNTLRDTTFIFDTVCYGEIYSDNGFPINSGAGIYYRTEIVNNSDSVICLTLTEYPQIPITSYSATFCQGKTYSDANFTDLTQAGIHYDTLQNVNGCDSIIELKLTVISIDTTHISESICEGESYDFFGRQLKKEGVYYETLQSFYGCDSVIELKLSVTVGIVETQLIASLPRIYPNPTTGKLTIESGELKIENVDIYDIYGKKHVSQFTFHDSQVEINISHLATGIYFLRIDGKTMKLIKE